MKQSKKTWLITAGILVLAGCIIFAGIMTRRHWNFTMFDTVELKTETVEINEDFQSISIQSDTEDISFQPSGNGKCSVIFREWEEENCSASVQNGVLTVKADDWKEWTGQVGVVTSAPKITVCLPKNDYVSISVKGSTGDIMLPDDFTFESVDISVSTGKVECHASVSEKLRIGSSTGDVCLEGLSAGEIELSTTTGDAVVSAVSCKGIVDITVSTGDVFLTDVSCGSFATGGSTGELTMKSVAAGALLSVSRSTGDVKLEKCDAAELQIKTSTGSVTGTLLSDKVFIVQSTTGSIKVPETVTGGKCKISTTTGDIKIAIELIKLQYK